jgi:hypothetical protein
MTRTEGYMSWENIADSHRAATLEAEGFAGARRRTARVVIAHAKDTADATLLLATLGLTVDDLQRPP